MLHLGPSSCRQACAFGSSRMYWQKPGRFRDLKGSTEMSLNMRGKFPAIRNEEHLKLTIQSIQDTFLKIEKGQDEIKESINEIRKAQIENKEFNKESTIHTNNLLKRMFVVCCVLFAVDVGLRVFEEPIVIIDRSSE